MIDLTHTKRPEFIQLVLILAVVCLALGAITPAASALEYDWEFSVQSSDAGEITGSIYFSDNVQYAIPNALSGDLSIYCMHTYRSSGIGMSGYYGTLEDFITNSGIFTDFPYTTVYQNFIDSYVINVGSGLTSSELDVYVRLLADFLEYHTDIQYHSSSPFHIYYDGERLIFWVIPFPVSISGFSYSYEPASSAFPLYVDVVDSEDDYLISVSGIDGSQLAGSAYTIAVSTFTGGYELPLTSFPMYLGDSPVHFWTSDETFTLPVYLSDGVTPIDYYCVMSFVGDPTYTGYQFWWNMTTSGYLDYPFDTNYPPVTPIPTSVIPEDIIPHPDDLNNTVNITGWYQDQGFEGNNITAPIYSGIRGWFNENLVPVIDFFLTPTNYVATVISDSAETSTDGISYITEELGSYAAPFNIVGGYVVLLIPEVVWIVVFAALSIGYVVLLIRVSTGSIKDTIGRFLGGK